MGDAGGGGEWGKWDNYRSIISKICLKLIMICHRKIGKTLNEIIFLSFHITFSYRIAMELLSSAYIFVHLFLF